MHTPIQNNCTPFNIALVLEYAGDVYYGLQKQKDSPYLITVQSEFETALATFTHQNEHQFIAAGRTDRGVHATYQVVNIPTNINRPIANWLKGLNALLPATIAVKDAAYVQSDFHARFSALERTYDYYIYMAKTKPAILNKKVGWCYHELNIANIKQACQYLIGEQDFSCFRASECQAKSPIRHVTSVDITIYDNHLLKFTISANAFLYHMVRNIIGALVYVGMGKLKPVALKHLIAGKSRTVAPPTFMADGLYLSNVKYLNNPFSYQPVCPFTGIKSIDCYQY